MFRVCLRLQEIAVAGAVCAVGMPGVATAQEACPATVTHTRYFAEGATGTLFSTVLALANPGPSDVRVRLRFQRPTGGDVTHCVTVPAERQASVEVAMLPGMAIAEFSTVVESDGEVVGGRGMSWGGGYGSHAETAGTNALATPLR